ncbi:MAG: YkgJ family cysteine cluster protein [Planctomycetota bacterium]
MAGIGALDEFVCLTCGDCCLPAVPVTIPDVHSIAVNRGITEEEAFRRFVQAELTPKSGSLQLMKKASGFCVFLASDRKCSIYEDRPAICRVFRCNRNARALTRDLSSGCAPVQTLKRLTRHMHATRLTGMYTARNGSGWNEEDYFQALQAFAQSVE